MCKKWLGNETICDICSGDLRKGQHFYDAVMKTPVRTWALVCEGCYITYRQYKTLGTGKGQQYDSITNLKTDG